MQYFNLGGGNGISIATTVTAVLFHPLQLANTQMYFAKNTATVNSWNDQSPNGYDLSQTVALQQPTIGANSVDFVPNQHLFRIGNAFESDTQGIFFFSGYVTSGVGANFISKCTSTTNNNFFYIQKTSADKIQIIFRNTSLSIDNFFVTDDTFGTGFIYGYMLSNGSSYTLSVNGIIRTVTFSSGSNDGSWFNFMDATNRLSVGALLRLSPIYSTIGVNKLYYNNTVLSAGDITNLEMFFSNPNIY